MFDDLHFHASLGSDNHSGVHPKVMAALEAANRGHAHAYGLDEVSSRANAQFERVFGPDVEAQYVFTGTAANVLSAATIVRSFEAIFCSSLAHLHLDECGAPEKFLGAKLWTLPTTDGRIDPNDCAEALARRGDQHFSQPRMISLTQPTELGVCYRLDELRKWQAFARRNNLMLHIDGARLANAAAFLKCSLRDLSSELGVDVVSFGGTKNGLMAAEAVLLFSQDAKSQFKFLRKQAMQLSSKTRFLAAQFFAYLDQDLWLDIAQHTTETARQIADRLTQDFPEVRLAFAVESNALFVHLPKLWLKPLRERFFFYVWDSDTSLCRWMISWDWNDSYTNQLFSALNEVKRCFPIK